MTDDDSTRRHLRVVGEPRRADVVDEAVGVGAGADRAAYWARLQALRAERQRLRAG